MPLYLDRHDVPGVTSVDLAMAHAKDVQIEKTYGVKYVTYWFDPVRATAFCLAEGLWLERRTLPMRRLQTRVQGPSRTPQPPARRSHCPTISTRCWRPAG